MELLARVCQGRIHYGKSIIVASHPRSGTHLLLDFIRKQFAETKSSLRFMETLHHQYLSVDHLSVTRRPHITQSQALSILCRPQRPLVKTHSLPGFHGLGSENADFVSELVKNADIFYAVRDGRHVMCSAHQWERYSGSTATPLSLSDFMRQKKEGRSWPRRWADHIGSWLDQPGVHPVLFEQLLRQPETILKAISQKLSLTPLNIKPLLPKRKRFQNRWSDYLARLLRQTESTTIIARPGGRQPEKWKQALTVDDQQFFHDEAGDILIRLGYEADDSWTARTPAR